MVPGASLAMIPTLARNPSEQAKLMVCWLNLGKSWCDKSPQGLHCLGLLMVCSWTGGVRICLCFVFRYFV